jgi:acetylornithine/succinyldiaminopimelate/putrescine aminotransferase
MGAILLTQTVADALAPGDHASTFAGGPLICSVAQTVFDHIRAPEFLAQVQATGQHLAARLEELAAASPLITAVRGKGLMWGLLSVPPAADIVAEARNHGLIILVAGPNVVRLLPPLIISREEADLLVGRLAQTLAAMG